MTGRGSGTEPIRWDDGELVLLDQRRLPHEVSEIRCRNAPEVCEAISTMVVRGAPAIGVTAAYGVALSAREHHALDPETWRDALAADMAMLRASRPTAVNLMWALDRMAGTLAGLCGNPYPDLLAAARDMHAADVAANHALGAFGAGLIEAGAGVLTHCNAGALATAGYGTALGVIRSAAAAGVLGEVFITETRPWLQGSRLTAWELMQDGIQPTLIADSAAAWLMSQGRVQWVVTGADRVAANGDAANKIGTYALATLARAHGVKFMIAAPLSTIDREVASGDGIPIEHRDGRELTSLAGQPVAAAGVSVLNPVFDVTPAELIDVLATERGVVERPDAASIARLFAD